MPSANHLKHQANKLALDGDSPGVKALAKTVAELAKHVEDLERELQQVRQIANAANALARRK